MDYIIEAEISSDKRLVGYALPVDIPSGPVKLVIHVVEQDASEVALTREEVRRRLLVAGKLVTTPIAPEGAIALTDQEREELAQRFGSGSPTSLDVINEDRGSKI